MKLSDLKSLTEDQKSKRHHGGDEEHFELLDLWQGRDSDMAGLESADVDVEYEYEPPDYTDHPYGSTYAREHHGGVAHVGAVRLCRDAKIYDDDGDKVIGTLKAGTDLTDQKWWKSSWTDWLSDKITKQVEDRHKYDRYDD